MTRSRRCAEWVEAIRGGLAASQHWPECGGPLTEMVLLGCAAIRSGGRFTNNAAANALLKANYQSGWTLSP